MNIYLVIILAALCLDFLLSSLSKWLDLKNLRTSLPDEFDGYYSANEYARSQEYLRTNTRFSVITSSFDLMIILIVIFFGLFDVLDGWVRSYNFSSIFSGLIFFGSLFIMQDIISTPFSLYKTFIIEEKYGFNKTSPKTYIYDKLKGYVLVVILGGVLLYTLLLFFESFGSWAWLYAWIIMSSFLVLIQPLFTLVIAPMFNKFIPLEDGSLKSSIEQFAQKTTFPISRIDVMDGSLRSSKANAYFSGLGKNKRIALFDTLIEKHTENELLSIIAHEIGHYKCKHNIKTMVMGIMQSGLMLFILSKFLDNPMLFSAFGVENISVYGGLLFFSLLYSPVDLIMSIITNAISRKHEFEADAFAQQHIGTSAHLIEGLKKLTVSNLGNLTPHPLTVWLGYSHPPILQRIRALSINR